MVIPENNTVVVMIENSGTAPLEIDPLQFTESNWDYVRWSHRTAS